MALIFQNTALLCLIGQVRVLRDWLKNPDANDAPSNLTSIGRYIHTPDIVETLRGLSGGSGGEIQLTEAINIHAQQGFVETVRINRRRFDCGSVDGFMAASMYEFASRSLSEVKNEL